MVWVKRFFLVFCYGFQIFVHISLSYYSLLWCGTIISIRYIFLENFYILKRFYGFVLEFQRPFHQYQFFTKNLLIDWRVWTSQKTKAVEYVPKKVNLTSIQLHICFKHIQDIFFDVNRLILLLRAMCIILLIFVVYYQ